MCGGGGDRCDMDEKAAPRCRRGGEVYDLCQEEWELWVRDLDDVVCDRLWFPRHQHCWRRV